MSALSYDEVEFGDELPEHVPDVSLPNVRRFTDATGMSFGRFNDHEEARKAGLPGAIVPGIMSQGIFAAMLHAWAPGSEIIRLDTIFRSPVVADTQIRCNGVVTDRDDDQRTVEIDLTMLNEADETGVLGTATVRLG